MATNRKPEMKLLTYSSDKYGAFYKPKDTDAVLKELYIRIKNLERAIEETLCELKELDDLGELPALRYIEKLKNELETSNITWETEIQKELESPF